MITERQIAEIISQYKKHGWNLSRVLVSVELEKTLSDKAENLFGTAEIVLSETNAAWFTRASNNQNTAWELRHLSDAPFALFEVFEAETEKELIEDKLLEMEEQMIEKFN